jgi:drug/metabolite transporter (DMT)-like permease
MNLASMLRNLRPVEAGNLHGAAALVGSAFFVSLMAALIKVLGADLPITQIVFIRQCVLAAIVLPMILRGFPGVLATSRPGLQMLRNGLTLAAMLLGFTAVVRLPLAEATSIGFTRGFFITILAIAFLGEKVGLRRWLAIGAGFAGVAVTFTPGSAAFSVYGMMSLASAMCVAGSNIAIREMAKTERASTVLAWQALGIAAATAIPACYFWQWPSFEQWLLLGLLGVISYAGQMLFILAMQWGEASFMAALDYVRLLFATAIGFAMFGAVPGANTWIGAAIIVAASLYTIHREAALRKPSGRGGETTMAGP